MATQTPAQNPNTQNQIQNTQNVRVSCNQIEVLATASRLLALQLYEYFDIKFVVGVIRKLFTKRLGEPVAEGWVYNSFPEFMSYVMIYPCRDENDVVYAKVEVEEDLDNVISTHIYVYYTEHDKIPIRAFGDEMTPAKVLIEVAEKQDESNKIKEFIKLEQL